MKAEDAIDALHHWYEGQTTAGSAGAATAGSERREVIAQLGAATTDIGGSSGSDTSPAVTAQPVIKALKEWGSRLVE